MTTIQSPAVVSGPVTAADTATGPKVLGLDLSLTSPGLAGNGWADTLKPPAKLRGVERMGWIRGAITDRYLTGVALVVVEGPSYGNQAGQSGHHERAGLWWLIRYTLHRRAVPVAVVSPASLKMYATGRGNAGKDDVLREVTRRFDWFQGDNNAADATILHTMGADHLGHPPVGMPKTNRNALAKCDWPDLAA